MTQILVAGQWHASPCVLQARAQEGADLELSSGGCVWHDSCLHPYLPPLLPVPFPGGLCSGRCHDEHSQSQYVPQLVLGWGGCMQAPGLTPFLAPCSDGVDISPGPPLDDDFERLGLQLWACADRLCGLWCTQLEDTATGGLGPLLPLLCTFMVGAAALLLKGGSVHSGGLDSNFTPFPTLWIPNLCLNLSHPHPYSTLSISCPTLTLPPALSLQLPA